jgi:hypothetical protein
VQRYLNHVELAIDFQIQLNILGILWNGLKTRVTSSYQRCSLLKCRYNSYTVCGLHFTSKYFGTNNRLLNVAVPSTQYNFPFFPVQTYFQFLYPTSTRRHGNFAGVHTLLRILLSSNSAVLINIITGVSPSHFDFVVYYVLCQC